jgi:hypothetical protein
VLEWVAKSNNVILFFTHTVIIAIIAHVKLKPSLLKHKQQQMELSLCHSTLKIVGELR